MRLQARGIRCNGHGIPSELINPATARLVDDGLQAKLRQYWRRTCLRFR